MTLEDRIDGWERRQEAMIIALDGILNVVETIRPADLRQVGAPATGIIPARNQPQHPSHPRSPSPSGRIDRNASGLIPPFGGHSPIL